MKKIEEDQIMRPEEDRITRLLQRYMDAETTAEEENMLRRYFERGDYPQRFAAYAEMFGATAQDFSVLTDVEADELLHLCPVAAVRPKRHIRHVMRYAAVWLCGLLLGGGVMAWLSRHDNTAFSSAPGTVQIASARVDTLIRERVIVQSDTVYMVKNRAYPVSRESAAAGGHRSAAIAEVPYTAAGAPQSAAAVPYSASGASQSVAGASYSAAGASYSVAGTPNTFSSGKNAEERFPVQDVSWDNFTNLADLAER